MIFVAYAFLIALIAAVLVTPLARRLSIRTGMMDRPHGRKRHRLATPVLGGLALFVSFGATIGLGLALWPQLSEGPVADTPLNWQSLGFMVLAGGLLMCLTGLLDDALDLGPARKLALHTLSALLVGAYFLLQGAQVRLFLEGSWALLAAPLTIFWLVFITNSMNLLDHADGLAAGISAIASAFLAVSNVLVSNYAVAFIAAAITGSCLGFLVYNRNPASIFMGDSGSNLLGFMLGLIAILGVYTPMGGIRELAVLTPLLVLAVPLVDTAMVLIYRWRRGEPLLKGDRNHLAHRLMRIGFSHLASVNMLYVIGVMMGTLAMLLPTLKPYQAVLVFIHAAAVVGVMSYFIHKGEGGRPGDEQY